ncbi:hypothetical protein EV426DRAFT_720870 [Tirmania nivea]|nr:hypothetical protein EV426DRAFT_720870 [Tirmania nivea]
MSTILPRPLPLHKASLESEVQAWLAYLDQQYPNDSHKLFSAATIMYRDQSHKANWLVVPQCSDLHSGAKFTDWIHMPMGTAKIRIGLFMSLQSTWVGNQNPEHQYLQHVWVAALRPATGNIRGKELIFWDSDWEMTRAKLVENGKFLNITYGLIGGQKAIYSYLKDKSKGQMNIAKIWIGGNGTRENCLLSSMQWVESILQTSSLEEDLESLGFYNLSK